MAVSPLQRLGRLSLLIGILLLPVQVGQGAFLTAYGLQWADVFLGLALVMGIVTSALTRPALLASLGRIWGLFWIAALLSAILANDLYFYARWLGLIYVTCLSGLVPMYFADMGSRSRPWFIAVTAVAVAGAGVDGLLQSVGLTTPYYGENEALLNGWPRLRGSFNHPNYLAHFLSVTGFLAIAYAKGRKRTFALGSKALVIALAISRSILVAPFWYLAVGENRRMKAVSLLWIASVLTGSVIFTRFAVSEGPSELTVMEAFRWKALLAALSTWQDSFWLGAGPGSAPVMIPAALESGEWTSAGDAMNTYVNLLSTLGVIGLITYALGWAWLIRRGVNSAAAEHRRLWMAFAVYNGLMAVFISVEDFRHLYLFSGWLLCLTSPSPMSGADLAQGGRMD
jgi:hypothetical protein